MKKNLVEAYGSHQEGVASRVPITMNNEEMFHFLQFFAPSDRLDVPSY